MAKLIFEHDNGHQVTFEIASDIAETLNSELGVVVWDEFMQVLKKEMLANIFNEEK